MWGFLHFPMGLLILCSNYNTTAAINAHKQIEVLGSRVQVYIIM